MNIRSHTFTSTATAPWTVEAHPFYDDIAAALKDKDNKSGLADAAVKLAAIKLDYKDHDFGTDDERNAHHWQGERIWYLEQYVKEAIAAPILDMDAELRKDAEFRSGRDDQGGFHGESLSWANIARDGRHGRGGEI